MIIRNRETKEYIYVPNKYGNSSLDFQTAYLYVSNLPEEERNKVEMYDRENNNVIEPKKFISNERYMLFLDSKGINLEDYAMGKIDFKSNYEYINFINTFSDEFETTFDKKVLSNQDEFTDYIKYKVLGAIAFNEAYKGMGVGYINSSPTMIHLLNKYNISVENNDNSLYSRISMRWEQGQKLRIVSNYKEEVLDKIPTKYLDKYLKILPDENADSHDLYRDIYKYKKIIEKIDKIEDKKEPVKFLINFSENRNLKSGEVLNIQEMSQKSNRAIDEVYERNLEDSKKYGENIHTYDKVDFTIILDDGKNFEIFLNNREDIGDYSNFNEYMKNTYTDEFNNHIANILSKKDNVEQNEEEI